MGLLATYYRDISSPFRIGFNWKVKRWHIVIILLATLLIGARLYLPFWLHDYVNKTLSKIPGYRGSVGEITVHLWRGAYAIKDLRLDKVNGKIPVPFFSATNMDLSVQWRELINGAFVGEISLDNPKLNFVNGPSKDQKQTSIDQSWQKAVKDLFPLKINYFRGTNGEIHFRDFHRDPKVDVHLDHLKFICSNLTNSESLSKSLSATLHAEGLMENKAPVKFDLKMDALKEPIPFALSASVRKLELTRLNDFFKAYASFDVQEGEFEFYTELSSNGDSFHGYAKPFLKDINVLSLENDTDDPLDLVWEAIVGFVAEIVENQSHDQIATKIPFSGKFSNPNPDTWEAIGSLLSNAFIEALLPGIDSELKGKN